MLYRLCFFFFFFFFNDTATTEIYTLSLHDALPISAAETPSWPGRTAEMIPVGGSRGGVVQLLPPGDPNRADTRSRGSAGVRWPARPTISSLATSALATASSTACTTAVKNGSRKPHGTNVSRSY